MYVTNRWIAPLAALLLGLTATGPTRASGQQETARLELEARIEHLIQQLGAEQFARRERAQSELARLGMAAFDGLREAQSSDDIEIAKRARYLVRSIRVHWIREGDPPEVKRVLQDYGNQSLVDRAARMERLASLADARALSALCRLARFEASLSLAKRAALIAVQLPVAEDEAARDSRARLIEDAVGNSKREASDWLRRYAQTLRAPDTAIDVWGRIANDERRLLTEFPERTKPEIVRDLLRWQVDLLRKGERPAEIDAVVVQMIELLDGRREALLNTVDWFLNRQLFSAVDAVAGRFPERFEKYLVLQYRLAEAQRKQGRREESDQIAEQALKTRQDQFEEHMEAAVALQERGLIDWCLREYRQIIDESEEGSVFSLRARFLISELMHDTQQELEAARTLQGVVDLLDKDRAVLERVQQPPLNRPPGGVKSRMHFFYGLHYGETGEYEKQFHHFREGLKHDPNDSDLLIGMFHAKQADEEWKQMTSRYIKTAAGELRKQIERLRQFSAQAPNESTRHDLVLALAISSNQLAWLVCNTEGDMNEALQNSLKSLELRPDTAAYLDTLAHCYFAKGDYENAVRSQQRAVELEPYTKQISRKLQLFKDKLIESRKAP